MRKDESGDSEGGKDDELPRVVGLNLWIGPNLPKKRCYAVTTEYRVNGLTKRSPATQQKLDGNVCTPIPTTLTTKLHPAAVIPAGKQSTFVDPTANSVPLLLVQLDSSTAPSRPTNCGSGQWTARRRWGLFAWMVTSSGHRRTSTVFSVRNRNTNHHTGPNWRDVLGV